MLALESVEFAYLLISMVYAKITSLIYFKLLLFKTEATVCNTTLIRADNHMIFLDSDFLMVGGVIIIIEEILLKIFYFLFHSILYCG